MEDSGLRVIYANLQVYEKLAINVNTQSLAPSHSLPFRQAWGASILASMQWRA